ncbi:hypothetical protein Tco_1137086, partial [Tanacetum coccineum]
SPCSDPWAKQLHRNTKVVLDKRNVQKEAPPNTPRWANQKKQLFPKGKQFLKQKVEEVVEGTEGKEKKLLVSYGVGEAFVETNEGRIVVSNVLFTPEITLNILSLDQLEEQGYMVNYGDNKCRIKYMFDDIEEAVEQENTMKEEDEESI